MDSPQGKDEKDGDDRKDKSDIALAVEVRPEWIKPAK